MPQISVLSKEISELIAAGEVIERPASVIKEVVENAVDAGAKHITVEIKHGGTTFMRITDDGCGMAPEDTATAFLRHATSKISDKDDLDNIYTLGFRGEALASISAVAKVSLLTKRKEDSYGTRYDINGSVPDGEPEQTGCPDGTTIIIRDLFYNVPVRKRFMKKDVSEANAVSQIVQKIALSHPEIAFQMIRDNRLEFCTDGSGDPYAAIYAVYGREFAHDMVPVEYDDGYIHVAGYTCKPLYAKSSRSFQNFFVNGRYVRSRVCSAAAESAYENLIMTGKFPSCVLMISLNASDVDVNIHPTKAEVRFTNEKNVADGLYFAIKNALMQNGLVYEFNIQPPKPFSDWTAPVPEEPVFEQKPLPETAFAYDNYKADEVPFEKVISETDIHRNKNNVSIISPVKNESTAEASQSSPVCENVFVDITDIDEAERDAVQAAEKTAAPEKHKPYEGIFEEKEMHYIPEDAGEPLDNNNYEKAAQSTCGGEEKKAVPPAEPIKVVGEIFRNYILAEAEGRLVIFDKHAAHERVIFEKLRSGSAGHSRQMLMTPVKVMLGAEETDALMSNTDVLSGMGFSFEFSGSAGAVVTGIPTFAESLDIEEIVSEIAHNLVRGKTNPEPAYLDDTFHTIACKAAIKANDRNDLTELQKLAEEVYNNNSIRHCPHGRPVMFVITKHELEKQFGRT